MAWKSHPKAARLAAGLPETQIELFTKILMYKTDSAVRQWRKRRPEMEARILTLQREGPLSFYRPGALHTMGQSAQLLGREGFADRKLLLEMTGDYRPSTKTDVTTAGHPIKAGPTADDLAALLAEAQRQLTEWKPTGEGKTAVADEEE